MNDTSKHSAIASFRVATARRQFDLLPSSELPDLALQALQAGLDSPAIRELAGELHPTWADAGPLFDRVLQDIGISSVGRLAAADTLARRYAEQILSGELAPYDGARRIWFDIANALWDDRDAWRRYSIFVGLASEWEDHASGRVSYEGRIRDEARLLLERNI